MATREYPQSLYLEPSDRPDGLSRNRSNSLPPGLALMNAEEAGLLFSTAERATARRRKIKSIDSPSWNTPVSSRPSSPAPPSDKFLSLPEPNSYKPSPLAQVENLDQDEIAIDQTHAYPEWRKGHRSHSSLSEPRSHIRQIFTGSLGNIPQPVVALTRAFTDGSPDPIMQTLPSLPMSPISPKRKVPTLSLKSYADGLFSFTHDTLSSKLPQLVVTSPSRKNTPTLSTTTSTATISRLTSTKSIAPLSPLTPPPEELASSQGVITKMRPLLSSRFSDWSNATESGPQSRRDSVVIEEDGIQEIQQELGEDFGMGASLMSPDSFFSAMEHTPRHDQQAFSFHDDLDHLNSRFSLGGISYASSETYEPSSDNSALPSTPPQRIFASYSSAPKEEISYFTNYDKYLDRNDSDSNLIGTQEVEMQDFAVSLSTMPDEVPIELTPFDFCQFPSPPGTAMRVPSEGRSAEVMMMETAILKSSHAMRSRRTETAVRVPCLASLTRARSFEVMHDTNMDVFGYAVPLSAPTTPYHLASPGLIMDGPRSWIGAVG